MALSTCTVLCSHPLPRTSIFMKHSLPARLQSQAPTCSHVLPCVSMDGTPPGTTFVHQDVPLPLLTASSRPPLLYQVSIRLWKAGQQPSAWRDHVFCPPFCTPPTYLYGSQHLWTHVWSPQAEPTFARCSPGSRGQTPGWEEAKVGQLGAPGRHRAQGGPGQYGRSRGGPGPARKPPVG